MITAVVIIGTAADGTIRAAPAIDVVIVAGTLLTMRRCMAGGSDMVFIVVDADLMIMLRLLRLASEMGGRLNTEMVCTRLLAGNELMLVGVVVRVTWPAGAGLVVAADAFGVVCSTFLIMSGVENNDCSRRGFLAFDTDATATEAAAAAESMRRIVCAEWTIRWPAAVVLAAVVEGTVLKTSGLLDGLAKGCDATDTMPLGVIRRYCAAAAAAVVVVGGVMPVDGIAVTTRVPSLRTRIIRFWADGRCRPAVLTTVRTVCNCAIGRCGIVGGVAVVDVNVAGF